MEDFFHRIGFVFLRLGDRKSADACFWEILLIHKEPSALKEIDYVGLLFRFGTSLNENGKTKEAPMCYQEVLKLWREHGEYDDLIDLLKKMAKIYSGEKMRNDSIRCVSELLKIYQDNFGEEDPKVANIREWASLLYLDMINNDEARKVLEDVARIRKVVLGDNMEVA